MEDDRKDRIEAYIRKELSNDYSQEKVAAMLVHAWSVDERVARPMVKRVHAEWTASEQKRRKKVRVALAMGVVLLAVGIVPAVAFGVILGSTILPMLAGIVLLVVAFKNMR